MWILVQQPATLPQKIKDIKQQKNGWNKSNSKLQFQFFFFFIWSSWKAPG